MKTKEKTKEFKVGDKVRWLSSNTYKVGEIVAVVPVGKTPQEVNYPKAGGGGIGRNHISYIVLGSKVSTRSVRRDSREAYYWPVVSLLTIDEAM